MLPLWVAWQRPNLDGSPRNPATRTPDPKRRHGRTHFHEKAIICQVGIGRAPWRSSDAAPMSSFIFRGSVALLVVGPMNRAIHTSIRTLSGLCETGAF